MSDRIIIRAPDTLISTQTRTVIVRQGIVGPPGSSTLAPWREDEFPLSGTQTVFTLAANPQPSTVVMFVNGLRQGRSNFTISGTGVTVTGFSPQAGDTVTFAYQEGV